MKKPNRLWVGALKGLFALRAFHIFVQRAVAQRAIEVKASALHVGEYFAFGAKTVPPKPRSTGRVVMMQNQFRFFHYLLQPNLKLPLIPDFVKSAGIDIR